jgi:phosphotransferase system enzyme I (PtsI)
VLRSLLNIVTAAKNAGIPVALCGEMAGDPVYTLVLVALGFDELSMTAGQIPVVKQIVRRVNRAETVTLLENAMRLTTAEEIERYIRGEMNRRFAEQS